MLRIDKPEDLFYHFHQILLRGTWSQGGELRSLGSKVLADAIRYHASTGASKIVEDVGPSQVVAFIVEKDALFQSKVEPSK
jgi:hypothetical protein